MCVPSTFYMRHRGEVRCVSCRLWAVAHREFENKESRLFLDATDQGVSSCGRKRPRVAASIATKSIFCVSITSERGSLLIQETLGTEGVPGCRGSAAGPNRCLEWAGHIITSRSRSPSMNSSSPALLAAFISAPNLALGQQTVLQTLRQRLGWVHL